MPDEITDIEITRDGELMICQIEGVSDAGIEFVDGYIPERLGTEYSVVDSGRILLAEQDVEAFIMKCRLRDFVVATCDVRW